MTSITYISTQCTFVIIAWLKRQRLSAWIMYDFYSIFCSYACSNFCELGVTVWPIACMLPEVVRHFTCTLLPYYFGIIAAFNFFQSVYFYFYQLIIFTYNWSWQHDAAETASLQCPVGATTLATWDCFWQNCPRQRQAPRRTRRALYAV